jgi:hypothetical protein
MKTIKNAKLFGATIIAISIFLMFAFMVVIPQSVSAYAQEENSLIACGLFSDKQIEASGYLYNFDGSPDYIFADFADSTGYAIFAEETMEVLEYTTVGDFPYTATNDELVYGGPRAYFSRNANHFVDMVTNEQYAIAAEETEVLSQFTRQKIAVSAKSAASRTLLTAPNVKLQNFISQNSLNNVSKNTKGAPSNSAPQNPPLDESSWISPTAGATYITNSEYFLTAGQSPRHGNNTTGTCTAVATQLMLSYNNFYNDRRIIAPEHLFGGWNTTSNNGNIFDPVNYSNRNRNPNVSTNYASMTSWTLGSNQDYHDMLVNNGITGYLHDAEGNLRTYLNGRLGANNFIVDSQEATTLPFGWGNWKTISSTNILAEINANRPVVIATGDNINGTEDYDDDSDPNTRSFNHSVVAYGYQTFAAYAGSGNSAEYLGYIVHMGWDENGGTGSTINVWTNSAWYYGYLKLEVNNHTHNYTVDTGVNVGNDMREVRCSECGHRTAVDLYNVSGNTITSPRYPLTGSIIIPSVINGTTITAIGASAFANQTQLSQITIPASVTSIGNSAFSGCTSLSQISIPSSVTKIGYEAFSPSTVLTSYGGNRANIDLVVADGTKDTYIANGWTGFNIVELSASGPLTVTSGQLRGIIEIPSTFNNRIITSIGASGFANQSEITGITLPMSVTSISSSAFANCSNLEYVFYYSITGLASTPDHATSYSNYYYTERSLDVNLSAGCSYTLSFDYSNLTASTDISNVFTSLGVGDNTFAVDLPVQKTFSSSSGTQVIVFTPTEAQLASSNKLWCRFIRTGTPQTVSINISNVEIDLGVTNINIDAFTGCEKLVTPGLSFSLLSDNTYSVTGIANEIGAIMLNITRTLFVPSVYGGIEVSRIAPSAFKDYDMIKWAFIQSGISSIGNRAFQFCDNLEVVDMSATAVTSIEAYTFDTCNLLESINLPNNLLTIGEGAFIRTKVVLTIPNSVTNIGNYAFAYGERLGFGLPDSLVSIGSYAFAYSDGMLIFTYNGSSLTTIGAHAFDGTPIPTVAQIYPSITTIGAYAYYNSSFYSTFALPAGSQLTTIGDYAFGNNNLTRIVLPSSITNIGVGAFNGNDSLTIYTERTSRPSTWNVNWNNSNRPVVWGCTLSSNKTYVISFSKTSSNPSNTSAANGITNPFRKDYNFGGWYTTSDFSGTQYMDLATAPNGILYAKWNTKSCVAEGTLITLADGSQVAVEDLTGEELLLVWNMSTGTFDTAPILFIDSDLYTQYEIIHLYFSDGTEVKVISEHGFWDIDLNEYVFLRSDASQYIGHWFNKQTSDSNGNMIWTAVQLVDVEVYTEYTTAWSPVTFGHLCYYVNGMLSMPGATEGLINIFEVDAATMQYDTDSFTADIATYGLFTYEEFAEIIPIPEIIFEAFNGQYLKVSIGKGLITMDGLIALIERYADFFTEEDDNTPDVQDDQNGHGNHNGQGNGNHHGHNNGNGNHNGHRRRGR